jgi:DNA-binding NtrC family response regulator
VRRLLRTILEKQGDEDVEADGVAPARRAVASGQIDVVITDQVMPDGTGLDVLSTCRESDAAIPVIF